MFCNNCGDAMDIMDYTVSFTTGMAEVTMECKNCELISIDYYTKEAWDNISNNY